MWKSYKFLNWAQSHICEGLIASRKVTIASPPKVSLCPFVIHSVLHITNRQLLSVFCPVSLAFSRIVVTRIWNKHSPVSRLFSTEHYNSATPPLHVNVCINISSFHYPTIPFVWLGDNLLITSTFDGNMSSYLPFYN